MGCSNQTIGGTVTVFLSSWGTWKSPETCMCLRSEEGEHGEEERVVAAGLVTAAEETDGTGAKGGQLSGGPKSQPPRGKQC